MKTIFRTANSSEHHNDYSKAAEDLAVAFGSNVGDGKVNLKTPRDIAKQVELNSKVAEIAISDIHLCNFFDSLALVPPEVPTLK